jgi:hypothetical protein
MNIDDILSRYDEKTKTLGIELRKVLLKELKGCIEIPDDKGAIIGYGSGTGYKDLVCTILLSKKGVNLGFYKGTELNDPTGLLKGKGKVHRFAEIRSVDDVKNPVLIDLISQGLKAHDRRKKLSG